MMILIHQKMKIKFLLKSRLIKLKLKIHFYRNMWMELIKNKMKIKVKLVYVNSAGWAIAKSKTLYLVLANVMDQWDIYILIAWNSGLKRKW